MYVHRMKQKFEHNKEWCIMHIKLDFANWLCLISPLNISSTLSCGWSGNSHINSEKYGLHLIQHISGYLHDDVIKWKHLPRYWPFVRGIQWSPVNSSHKGQWCGALMFFFVICAWINGWVNNREAGDLRRHRAHYDVIVVTRIYPSKAHWD